MTDRVGSADGGRSNTSGAGDKLNKSTSDTTNKGDKANPDDGPPFQVVNPDLQVQLFLEAAGRASVYIENWFRERSHDLRDRGATAGEHEAFQQSRVSEIVQVFRRERPKLEAERDALRVDKAVVESGIAADVAEHERNMAADKAQYEADLAEMEQQIAALARDSDEAENWVGVEGPPARSQLQALLTRIDAIAQTTEDKIRHMEEDHEDAKRLMRENLVLRLRAVRDAAAADAAAAGDGTVEDESAVLIGKPTTKTNERLTREVAVYVRESLSLEHALAKLQHQEAMLSSEMQQKASANEKLILQNAASQKTRRILQTKLKELESQLAQVERDAERRLEERANSLVMTSSQQGMIIEELNDEIDTEIDNLLQLKAELREAQEQRLVMRRKSRAASRFFLTCASELTGGGEPTSSPFGAADEKEEGDGDGEGEQEDDEEEEDSTVLFLPASAGRSAESGAIVSRLGRIDGRKDAAQLLMRLMSAN